MIVSYDELWDKKLEAGAKILKEHNPNLGTHEATKQARLVLLAAASVPIIKK